MSSGLSFLRGTEGGPVVAIRRNSSRQSWCACRSRCLYSAEKECEDEEGMHGRVAWSYQFDPQRRKGQKAGSCKDQVGASFPAEGHAEAGAGTGRGAPPSVDAPWRLTQMELNGTVDG